jgi:hypothetical protein
VGSIEGGQFLEGVSLASANSPHMWTHHGVIRKIDHEFGHPQTADFDEY